MACLCAAQNNYIRLRMPKLMDEALRTNDLPQIITEATPPFTIVHVNAMWCQLCGFTAEEAVGRTCHSARRRARPPAASNGSSRVWSCRVREPCG